MLEEISPLRRRHDLGVVHLPTAARYPVQRLADDVQALLHLQHADEIAVVDVAVGADRDIELEALVTGVREALRTS